MDVDTHLLRKRAEVIDHEGYRCDSNLMHDAADEIDRLRKRCEQLERLLCSGEWSIYHSVDGWAVVSIDASVDHWHEAHSLHDTRESAIDAAIKYLEESDEKA